MAVPSASRGRVRASNADREQVIDALKAAFVQGRLTKGELDARVGRTLAARTYAELAAVTAGIPPRPDLAQPSKRARTQPRGPQNRGAGRAVKSGVAATTAMVLAAAAAAAVTGSARLLVLAMVVVVTAAICTAFVTSVVAVALGFESLHRTRSRRRLPPGSASGTGGRRVDGSSAASAKLWRQLGPHCSHTPAG
jgi:hypothetical protein